jgi:hypothetical protein
MISVQKLSFPSPMASHIGGLRMRAYVAVSYAESNFEGSSRAINMQLTDKTVLQLASGSTLKYSGATQQISPKRM